MSDNGRYLYRTMEGDLKDLTWIDPLKGYPGDLVWDGVRLEKTQLDKYHPLMKKLAAHCISNRQPWDRSILMPACIDFMHCRVWWGQADANHRNNRGMIVRMKRRNIGEERLIDLSTLEAQKAFFENSYEKWGHYVAEAGPKLGRSIEHGEVRICFTI